MCKAHKEYVKIFDEWRSPVRGTYSMYLEYHHHSIGHNPITDPMMEWNSRTEVLYINYQIIPSDEIDEDGAIKQVRKGFHELGIPYNGLITRLEKMWAKNYNRYKFTTYFKVDHLPTKQEIKRYESIFQDIEKESSLTNW